MISRAIVSITIVIVLSLTIVPVASAHNTVPRVEISIERLHPGEIVDVRGVSFGMDDSVTLTLIGSGVDVSFGEVIASGEGDFTYIAVLPADLVEGTYYFRAVTSHHYVLSSPLTVWGTAFTEGGGQGPRDEDDGLLAPMPTFAPGVVPDDAISQGQTRPASEATPAANWNPGILVMVVLLVLGSIVGFGLKLKNAQ
jgi:hypothetical protein